MGEHNDDLTPEQEADDAASEAAEAWRWGEWRDDDEGPTGLAGWYSQRQA